MFSLQKGNFIPLLQVLSLTQILKCVQFQVWSDFKTESLPDRGWGGPASWGQ